MRILILNWYLDKISWFKSDQECVDQNENNLDSWCETKKHWEIMFIKWESSLNSDCIQNLVKILYKDECNKDSKIMVFGSHTNKYQKTWLYFVPNAMANHISIRQLFLRNLWIIGLQILIFMLQRHYTYTESNLLLLIHYCNF